MIEHGGDPVKPEAIEPVDVDPHFEVGQQEPQNLPLGVVEEARVPEGVVTAASRVEEASICNKRKKGSDIETSTLLRR